jgi:small subunit ribosomal protein S7
MSRRTAAKKRVILPDPIFRSQLASMAMSRLLMEGKKGLARRLFYESLEHVERLTKPEGEQSKPAPSTSSKAPQQPAKGAKPATTKGSTSSAASGKETGTGSTKNTRPSSFSEAITTLSTNSAPLKIFQQAVLNVTPVVEVKSRRVGGSNYQVPLEVNPERGTALALRWLIQAARQRPGREMAFKLANEFLDASNKTGNAIRKREETHRMAEANKAFANYRF